VHYRCRILSTIPSLKPPAGCLFSVLAAAQTSAFPFAAAAFLATFAALSAVLVPTAT